MSADIYPPGDVTMALMRLAVNHGDVEKTASELIDDRFQVPVDTLRVWMLESHQEQYKRFERDTGTGHERLAIARLRETISRSAQLEADMLEQVATITNPALQPNALRAIADVKSKATTELLQLTGRPVSGAREGSADAMGNLVRHMLEKGYLKAADGVTLEPAIDVEPIEEAEAP